ncbi:conserved hypothetical protein [Collimonas fungivorans Ter331]|uniref:Toxin HigB-2 n=3 Tax=Collimonas fungivorans TaxID=158899 RepID=G0ACV8_COLFT|nr:conserved hypothetical protein [Collimonas fungivorans Ter331]
MITLCRMTLREALGEIEFSSCSNIPFLLTGHIGDENDWCFLYTPMAYIMIMEFIETPTFTRMITALLAEEEYRELQSVLMEDPSRGDVIKDGGGIRKMRYAARGRGKSGGIRVIYYWIKDNHQVYMLVAYPKSKKDTLSDKEIAILREFVKEL